MIRDIIDFFKITDKAIWQHVVLVSICIPFVLYIWKKIQVWYFYSRPVNLLFKGYKNSKTEVLIFLSQLSGAIRPITLTVPTSPIEKSPNQLYVTHFPRPIPNNRANLEQMAYQNIDPVWSESDGRCAADVFNILGRINIIKHFRIADTIKDWDNRENPIFSIGFNPKTRGLISECDPINFILTDPAFLQIKGQELKLDAFNNNDAGIIQKTFIRNSSIPVIILAGLGTTGTEV